MRKTGFEKFHKIKFNSSKGRPLFNFTCIDCGVKFTRKFEKQKRCGTQASKKGCSYRAYLEKLRLRNKTPKMIEYQRAKYWRLKKQNPEFLLEKSRRYNRVHGTERSREWWRKNKSPNPEKYGYAPTTPPSPQ